MVAGAVGVPVFFVLLLTIGPSQDSFSGVSSMVEQVASYQFVGTFWHQLACSTSSSSTVESAGKFIVNAACSVLWRSKRALLQSWGGENDTGPLHWHSLCISVPFSHLLLHLLPHGAFHFWVTADCLVCLLMLSH